MQSQGSQAQVGFGFPIGIPHDCVLSKTGCVNAHPPIECSFHFLELNAVGIHPVDKALDVQ